MHSAANDALRPEFHPMRFVRPCHHYVRPVSLATRLGLLIGRRWCMCYLIEDAPIPPGEGD